jgi:hypothetical protein
MDTQSNYRAFWFAFPAPKGYTDLVNSRLCQPLLVEVAVTPSKAGREFIARGASVLRQCPERLTLLAVAVALIAATVAVHRINTSVRFPSALAFTDPS